MKGERRLKRDVSDAPTILMDPDAKDALKAILEDQKIFVTPAGREFNLLTY